MDNNEPKSTFEIIAESSHATGYVTAMADFASIISNIRNEKKVESLTMPELADIILSMKWNSKLDTSDK